MRDQVTTTIDPYLKQLYELLKDKIGKSYREVLEEGIRREVEKHDPISLLRHDITRGDLEQEERRQLLARLEFNQSQMLHQDNEKEKTDKEREELQKYRVEMFEKDFKTFAWQWKDTEVNWRRIIELGKFNDAKEAKKWLEKELKERKLMDSFAHYS